jgi:putative flippase GtrA
VIRWRFGRFVVVGVVSAAVDLALVAALDAAGSPYPVAVTAGFVAGLAVNYWLHARYTFGVVPRGGAQLARFLTVVLLNYLLTLAVVGGLHGWLGVPVVLAKLASLPPVAVNGYLLSRSWVFRAQRGRT